MLHVAGEGTVQRELMRVAWAEFQETKNPVLIRERIMRRLRLENARKYEQYKRGHSNPLAACRTAGFIEHGKRDRWILTDAGVVFCQTEF